MGKVGPDDFGYAIEANDDLQNLLRDGVHRWVLNGHSHRQMVRDFGGLVLINAGTLARHRDPCFLELDFEEGAGLLFTLAARGEVAPPRPFTFYPLRAP
jgi:hypothetical protein